jgi:hypothetical protein
MFVMLKNVSMVQMVSMVEIISIQCYKMLYGSNLSM